MTHHEGKLLLRTPCNAEELRKQVDTMRRLFLLNVSDEAEQELVTEQIKSLVRELQQIKGDSGVSWTFTQHWTLRNVEKTFANSANLRRHITTQHNKRKAVTEPSQPNVKCVKFVSLAINVHTI